MDVHIATDSGAGRRVQCVPLAIPTGFPPISGPPRELHTGMASCVETTRQDASLSSRPKLPHTPHLEGRRQVPLHDARQRILIVRTCRRRPRSGWLHVVVEAAGPGQFGNGLTGPRKESSLMPASASDQLSQPVQLEKFNLITMLQTTGGTTDRDVTPLHASAG